MKKILNILFAISAITTAIAIIFPIIGFNIIILQDYKITIFATFGILFVIELIVFIRTKNLI